MWLAIGRNLYKHTPKYSVNLCKQMTTYQLVVLNHQHTKTPSHWKQYRTSSKLLSTQTFVSCDDHFDQKFSSVDMHFFDKNDKQLLTPDALKEMYDDRREVNTVLDNCDLKSAADVIRYFRNGNNYSTMEYLKALSVLMQIDAKDQLNEQILGEILNRIESVSDQMSASESIFCLHYLLQLGASIDEVVCQKLLAKVRTSLIAGDASLSIKDLARFARIIKVSFRKYQSNILNFSLFPMVLHYLNKCTSLNDMYYVTLCFHNMEKEIWAHNHENWINYEKILKQLINEKSCQFENHEVLEIITFTNEVFAEKNVDIQRKLLLMLKPRIPLMNEVELELAFRSARFLLEPFEIISVIEGVAKKKLLNNQEPSIELLTCCVMNEMPDNREKLISQFDQIISKKGELLSLNSMLYRALRISKISERSILDRYWEKITKEIEAEHLDQNRILAPNSYLDNLRHNYVYFNNNLAGTYRYKPFEVLLIDIYMNDIKYGMSGILPYKLARAASFIIAYNSVKQDDTLMPDFVLDKIESMADQFRSTDCLALSKGLETFFHASLLDTKKQNVANKIFRIQNVLNRNFERHIDRPTLDLRTLNNIGKAFVCRRTSQATPFFNNLSQKYEEQFEREDININSRHIRVIVYNMYSTSLLIPNIAEKVLKYVYDNRHYVWGDTLAKVLHCLYKLGYEPIMSENAAVEDINFEELGAVISRDFDYINATNIVRSCLALCYFRALPQSLIDRVFSIEFITRLEEEIKLCYFKEVHSQRILNDMMQLNRAVCFEYPEARVPWFQQNYVESQISKLPVRKNSFYYDIYNKLAAFVKDDKFLKLNHVTPYGYRIEFVVHMDRNRNLLVPVEDNEIRQDVFKFAVIPVHKHNRSRTRLLGIDNLKERHLQILGYRVVLITYKDWNSMYMDLPGAKLEYLKEQLFIQ